LDDSVGQNVVVRAVIVAAGSGSRFGGAPPKQFAPLAGAPLFVHSLRRLANVQWVCEIVIVLPREGAPVGIDIAAIVAKESIVQRVRVVAGGARRQDSVAAGLAALDRPLDIALVHDAARPFPPIRGIEALIERVGSDPSSGKSYDGGLLAIPATDTVKLSHDGIGVDRTLERERVWLAQTPQAISSRRLDEVIELLRSEEEYTDESAALERLGASVALIRGSADNIKVTRAKDLMIAAALMAEHGV
jgi:2-C-methyl-D-erythritol 4-phosphate cytidylyltransferase